MKFKSSVIVVLFQYRKLKISFTYITVFFLNEF